MRGVGVAAAILLALLGTGCTPAGETAARSAAESFQVAVGDHDLAAACALLSDEARNNLESVTSKSCDQVLAGLQLPTGAVEAIAVWGDNAQVRTSSDVMFLAQFSTGWRVTAAGCTPREEQPYDCAVEG